MQKSPSFDKLNIVLRYETMVASEQGLPRGPASSVSQPKQKGCWLDQAWLPPPFRDLVLK